MSLLIARTFLNLQFETMKNLKKVYLVYFSLLIFMLISNIIWEIYGELNPYIDRTINSLPLIVITGLVGLPCVKISTGKRMPSIHNKGSISSFPIITGLIYGLIQVFFTDLMGIIIPYAGFPVSVPVYLGLSIYHELLFHFIPLIIIFWIFSSKLFRHRNSNNLFWILAAIISLAEPLVEVTGLIRLGLVPDMLSIIFVAELIFIANMIAMSILRKYGLVSAIIFRASAYLVWFILLGGLV